MDNLFLQLPMQTTEPIVYAIDAPGAYDCPCDYGYCSCCMYFDSGDMSYDPKCEELARHFAQGQNLSEAEIADLSYAIQSAVDAWFILAPAPNK